mmetsp:Transcript_3850/g.13332  ORF Transcript_3850/g.13332 Transcript_3850/m.13332 type:complete len:215 (+) Transcript_3850:315-959(+)
MRRSAWSMPWLRSETKARSFHLDAHTSQSALHARSHRSSSSGGSIPAAAIAVEISSSIPLGGWTVRTHARQFFSVVASDSSEESSTAASRFINSRATDALIGSLRMCSSVPNGTTMLFGSLIHFGIFPPPKDSFSARVFLALAPTTPCLNSERGTVYLPQKGMLSNRRPPSMWFLDSAPAAPFAAAASTALASTSSQTICSPLPTLTFIASPTC